MTARRPVDLRGRRPDHLLSCRIRRTVCVHTCYVHDGDAPKASWVISFPAGPPDKDALARIVDLDGGRDDAENSYYEAAADPSFVLLESARRRFRAQYLRRLRRRADRDRQDRI
jgi:hypothetical protein